MWAAKKSKSKWRRIGWLVVMPAWLAAIVTGFTLLARHDTAAGVAGAAPQRWPDDSRIPLNTQGHTLVMFAHPRCPCTRASLGELEKLLARCPNAVNPWIVFFKPSGADGSWGQTDQWFTASRRLGLRVLRDEDAAEARRFGVMTSGHTMLYGPTGERLFSGGITSARGHAGDNEGRSAIEAILTSSMPASRQTPVYGCPIVVSQK
jgi:hypothetical protein